MNAIVFYSNTGQSASIARYLTEKLHYPIFDIEKVEVNRYDNLVLIFPVHCQNIPYVVKCFLKSVQANYLTIIATYGKMCCGNVLYEIQKKYSKCIVAGAYVPAKHTYLDESFSFDFAQLTPLVEKITHPKEIAIPKLYKHPCSNLFPRLRSRIGLKIYKNSNCVTCGACTEHCHFNAIKAGVTNSKCIRCLKCVAVCPNNALEFKIRLPLKLYLRKKQTSKTIIYI